MIGVIVDCLFAEYYQTWRLLLDNGAQQFGDCHGCSSRIGLHQNRPVGAQRERRAQRLLTRCDAAGNGDDFGRRPFSFSRTASSTAISSKGFIDIFTFAVSTPDAIRADANLHVVIDDALYGNDDFRFFRTHVEATVENRSIRS